MPLDGTGVLELINHDVLQMGTNLLKDERRVVILNHLAKERRGIAEHETLGGVIEFASKVFDILQEPHIVYMFESFLGREILTSIVAAVDLYLLHERVEGGVDKIENDISLFLGLFYPGGGVFVALLHANFLHVNIEEQSIGKFIEIVYDTTLAIGEIRGRETVFVDFVYCFVAYFYVFFGEGILESV